MDARTKKQFDIVKGMKLVVPNGFVNIVASFTEVPQEKKPTELTVVGKPKRYSVARKLGNFGGRTIGCKQKSLGFCIFAFMKGEGYANEITQDELLFRIVEDVLAEFPAFKIPKVPSKKGYRYLLKQRIYMMSHASEWESVELDILQKAAAYMYKMYPTPAHFMQLGSRIRVNATR